MAVFSALCLYLYYLLVYKHFINIFPIVYMLYDSSSILIPTTMVRFVMLSRVGVCMRAWEEKNFQILSTKHLTTTS